MQTLGYTAIARRFRPKSFKEVTGQEAIVTTIKNALKYKKVSHAYLFSGIRGTGKTTLARLFAKAINCEALTEEGDPCNACTSCMEIANGKSLDILEIDGASNRGIDDIRNLQETLGYASPEGRSKIFIIDEVHMLTKEAFNALLKSLEEPPRNVKFFLATTEPQKVLPTILSRCQRFDLSRIPASLIIQKLRMIAKEIHVAIEDEALSLIAKISDGSLRDAESLFDQITTLEKVPIRANDIVESLGFVTREDFFALDTAFSEGDLGFGFTFASRLFTTGRDMTFFLENLLEHYRNIALLLLDKISVDLLALTESEKTGYQEATKIYQLFEVLHILDYLSNLIHQTTRPSFKKIHIEMILMHILQTKKRVFAEHLIERFALGESMTVAVAPPPPKEAAKRVEPEVVHAPVFEIIEKAPPVVEEIQEKCVEPVVEAPSILEKKPGKDSVQLENIIRFAQVELGGVLKKNF